MAASQIGSSTSIELRFNVFATSIFEVAFFYCNLIKWAAAAVWETLTSYIAGAKTNALRLIKGAKSGRSALDRHKRLPATASKARRQRADLSRLRPNKKTAMNCQGFFYNKKNQHIIG